MHELEKENWDCFDDQHNVIIDSILSSPASSIQMIKTWLIELFVRGVVPITPVEVDEEIHLYLRTYTNATWYALVIGQIGDMPSPRKIPSIPAGKSCTDLRHASSRIVKSAGAPTDFTGVQGQPRPPSATQVPSGRLTHIRL